MSLHDVARALVAHGKGILAADESDSTCAKRFDTYSIEKTAEMRRTWRELLFSAPGIEKDLSGIILYDETIRQKTSDGTPFADYLAKRGIIPGIKVDQKTESYGANGEEVTKGLDGLSKRLQEYARMGAQFTKWRAVIRIDGAKEFPTKECIVENARRLAQYAKASQEAGLVPILEPEVLLDGTHTLARSESVIIDTLKVVFGEVKKMRCDMQGLLLKSSMALPGKESGIAASPEDVAGATIRAFLAAVPKNVAGIVFLSGGQTAEEATLRLNAIAKLGQKRNVPWPLTFSYSRALQDPVMAAWLGKRGNGAKAQEIFKKRVAETAAASEGKL